jgi:hypothetical protein
LRIGRAKEEEGEEEERETGKAFSITMKASRTILKSQLLIQWILSMVEYQIRALGS